MNPHVFRAYDIRGVADRDLSDDFAHNLGRAYGSFLRRSGGSPKVAIGWDARLSSDRIRDALKSGLHACGCDTISVGMVPTPLLYFATHTLDVGGGIMVTGSHNPAQDNGFKMMLGLDSLHGKDIQSLRKLMEQQDFDTGSGTDDTYNIRQSYEQWIRSNVSLGERPLSVVIDAGNGPTGPIVPGLLEDLGCEVTGLYCEPDGRFPNHHPDPTVAANLVDLQQAVRASGADLGIAYDGDGDRIGVVDEHGEIIWGDRLMVILSRALLAEEPGAIIVGEVKCSQTLFDDIRARGGQPVMSRVGHSLIKAEMKARGALLAGEMSGHIFYKHRYFGYDDATYATCRLLEILSRQDGPLSELLNGLPETFSTPELRLDCPDAIKFDVVERVKAQFTATHEVIDIDGARVLFHDGWGLVRASNTGPVLVLRCEAQSQGAVDRIEQSLKGAINAAKADL
ncbi:MAG TPA: phosphomannomutase [Myxococcales bacterium]|nr:phosphomannomutase [Myxococcales bacterium]HAN32713.1 phosphomannomutase [Myxococcales bacterium]